VLSIQLLQSIDDNNARCVGFVREVFMSVTSASMEDASGALARFNPRPLPVSSDDAGNGRNCEVRYCVFCLHF